MSTKLNVNQISINYRENTAVEGVSFTLEAGRIGCLLGPSGCGKTTILRAISGFEPVRKGNIILGDRSVSDSNFTMPSQDRRVGMVFQDFALYPHLTVEKNVQFGLNKWSKHDRKERAASLLKLVKLEDFSQRYPHELSGGQQQRVALIRAMAPKPDILLMDEPFSSMDTELRHTLAAEVRSILKQENITTLLVTHDQSEAFAMADDIGVMENSRLVQWGSAKELYFEPKNPFVAKFIGKSTLLKASYKGNGMVESPLGLTKVKYMTPITPLSLMQVRPQDVVISLDSDIKATITSALYLGHEYLYTLKLTDDQTLLCVASSNSNYKENDQVGIKLISSNLISYGV